MSTSSLTTDGTKVAEAPERKKADSVSGAENNKDNSKTFLPAPPVKSITDFCGRVINNLIQGPEVKGVHNYEQLVKLSDEEALTLANDSNHLDIDALAFLAHHKSTQVRVALAKRASLSDGILKLLVADASPEIRMALAKRASLPYEILKLLAEDESPEVLLALSRQASPLHNNIVLQLARCKFPGVRAAVAENHGDPLSGVLGLLAKDKSLEVRVAVAKRYKILPAIVEVLLDDQSPEVRVALARRNDVKYFDDDVQKSLAKDESPEVRVALAENNGDLLSYILELLAEDASPEVRIAVAGRGDLPDGILESLAEDQSPEVRMAVAKRDNLQKGILESLAKDKSPEVLELLFKNHRTNLSDESLRALSDSGVETDAIGSILKGRQQAREHSAKFESLSE